MVFSVPFKCLPLLCVSCVALIRLSGQIPAPPSFEVASVKSSDPGQRAVDFLISAGGRLRVTNLTLVEMIRFAYEVKPYQISGAPGWAKEDRFNIDAKAPG